MIGPRDARGNVVRPTRVVSVNEPCATTTHAVPRHLRGRAGASAPSPARTTPSARSCRSAAARRPTRRCPPTRSPPAAAAWTRTSRPPTPTCRSPGSPRPAASSADQVRAARRRHTPTAARSGFLGEPRVNVLELNLALDQKYPDELTDRWMMTHGEPARATGRRQAKRGRAAHLPRRGTRRRQDLRDARRGAPAARARHRRGRRGRRDPRPQEDRRAARRHRGHPAALHRLPRHAASPNSTSTPCWRRHPQVVLVDELAHTNTPGSKNPKRWQDVEELLDAGITVISTVNVQHLESLNDVVAQITGIEQQENGARRGRARAPTRSNWSTSPRKRCGAGSPTATSTPPSGSTRRCPTTSAAAT